MWKVCQHFKSTARSAAKGPLRKIRLVLMGYYGIDLSKYFMMGILASLVIMGGILFVSGSKPAQQLDELLDSWIEKRDKMEVTMRADSVGRP